MTQPKLRFPQFSGDWELRRIGEIGETISGVGFPEHEQGGNIGIPFYKVSDMNLMGNELIMQTANHYVTEEQIKNNKWKVINSTPAIIFAKVGAALLLDRKRLVLNDFLIDNNTMAYTLSPSWDTYFAKTIFETIYLPKFAQIGALPSFNGKDIENIVLKIPTDSAEQTAIGNFFLQLDSLITLHQRKLENAKNLKKGLLQKMFPKNGESVPEIRFPEFTDAWEQRKLGEVTKRVRGNDGRMNLPTLTMSASSGWLNQIDRFSSNIAGNEQKNYTLLKKGQLSYNHGNSKLAKYGVVFELTSYDEALVPKVYHSFETNEKAKAVFLEYMFATKLPDRELGKLVSSGTRMDGLLNISYDDFMSIKITIPTTQEQTAIGNLFRQLDSLITLHQRKLEHLKQLKKSLLQQMFV